MAPSRQQRMRGMILGTAVGDAVGLPAEGVSRSRSQKLFPRPWRHRLLFGRGMVSDDTEHTWFVGQALLAHPDSPDRFARHLAWSLRLWLLTLPAGIGFATLRSILRLWAGFPPTRSGVRSAGNGPAMRAAPLGAFFDSRPERREEYLAASTRLTHRDERALHGARVVARLTDWSLRAEPGKRPTLGDFIAMLCRGGEGSGEWMALVERIERASIRGDTVLDLSRDLGLERGVTGYVYHTVPVCAFAWFRHLGDFRATVEAVLDCGGDTDTTGAIAGAMAGAAVGEEGIPGEWIEGLWEWPRSVAKLRSLADRLALAECTPVPSLWLAIPLRNLLFLAIVLAHGLRRIAPPY